MKKILLTGAAGQIGSSLLNSLSNQYYFRCLDNKPVECEEDVVVTSISDFETVLESMQDMDAVIHLAAHPGYHQTWEDAYTGGIGGTYNVFEAARRAGVKKVVYASSPAVLGTRRMLKDKTVSTDKPFHPVTLYGVGKATGELLARYFAEKYGMTIICIRISSFYVNPPYPKSLKDYILEAWCSPDDLAQLVHRCLNSDEPGFQVFYGVSNNKHCLWDITNARKLIGFQPKDNADDLIKPPDEHNKGRGVLKDHALLLRAAVLEDSRALESWQSWLEKTDHDKASLDTLSCRLLPLVYYNLTVQESDHAMSARLKCVYRRVWLENQQSLQKVIPLINQLHDTGISILLLDDLTSILRLYDGQGVRRLHSLDILVQPADIPGLLAFLGEQKFRLNIGFAERFLTVETPLEVRTSFGIPCSIAWRVAPSIKTHGEAAAAWQHANPDLLGDCPVLTLDLETHFLRACLRTMGTRYDAAFSSLIDVAWMLRERQVKIDWERVEELARLNHMVLPVVKCLEEINGILEIPKANELLEQFRKMPVLLTDRLEHRWVYPYRPYPDLFTQITRRLLLYRRSPRIPGSPGFFRYLQIVWGASDLHSLPGLVLRQFWRSHINN